MGHGKAKMKIRCGYGALVPLSELKSHPKNRNQHPYEQIERLANILKYQGWRYPVKVSKLSGFVTSGHGRIEAARLNGWEQIPVDYQDYDSPEQEYADLQADNAIALWAELDFSNINADLPEFGPELDVDMLGIKNFTVEPLDRMPEAKNTGAELDLNAFDNFQHNCPKCGFGWNDV
jgi:hypothetical protein